jgi:hypothetical protein
VHENKWFMNSTYNILISNPYTIMKVVAASGVTTEFPVALNDFLSIGDSLAAH